MLLDTEIPLSESYACDEVLRAAMIDIAGKATSGREAASHWAEHLRFIASDTNTEPGTVKEWTEADEAAQEEADLPFCSCVWHASRPISLVETNLMITDPIDTPDCQHYLAVSYCWQSSAQAAYDGLPYTIRRKDNTAACKCPPGLLRRVLHFAYLQGIRYVWIDQECIEQHDPVDKGVGIQAMDLVYQYAEKSVAVLEARINKQRHLDALGCLQESSGNSGPHLTDEEWVDMVEMLNIILGDPWFERAWCLQESTSAARTMTLLMKRDPDLKLPDVLDVSANYHDELELELVDLQWQITGWLADQADRRAETGDLALSAQANEVFERWRQTLIPDTGEVEWPICNAAEALFYMTPRFNTVVSDRLAILANLCAYDVRLDSVALDQCGYGFSVCAITLATLNGDFSLQANVGTHLRAVASQARRENRSSEPRDLALKDRMAFSWNVPRDVSIADLLSHDKKIYLLRYDACSSLSGTGIALRGSL